jgi:hypothetical protein
MNFSVPLSISNIGVSGYILPAVDVFAGSGATATGLAFVGTNVGSNQVGVFIPVEVGGGATQYLATDPTVIVNVYDHAAGYLLTTNVVFQPVHVAYAAPLVSQVGMSNAPGYRVDLQTVSSSTNGKLSLGNVTALANGSAINEDLTLATGLGVGPFTNTVSVVFGDSSTLNGANSSISTNQLTVTGAVFNYAEGAVSGSSTISYTNGVASNVISLGNIHEGGSFGTTNLVVSNSATGASGYVESLAGSFTGSNNVTVSGDFSGVASGSNATITLSLGITNSGSNTGSVGVVFTSQTNNLETGLVNTVLGTNTVSMSGFVYTGQSTWTAASGAWTSFANWNALGGTPGLDGVLSTNDSATFGSAVSGTVTLNTNAALNALNFSSSSSAYTLGGSGTITLVQGSNAPLINNFAGSNGISSALNFATNVTITSATASRITLAGNIVGPGGLTKNGSGTAVLTGVDSFAGGSVVDEGTLFVNGSIQNSVMTVLGSGTLGGNGSIGGPVTISSGGTLVPGSNGVGALTFTNGLTLQAGSTTTFLINSTNNFTSINLIGSMVNYGGALEFNIVNYIPAAGDAFVVFNMSGAPGVTGNFSSVTSGSLIFTYYDGIWSALDSQDKVNYQFKNSTGQLLVEAVPEPSVWGLFGIGALVILIAYRRKLV